MKATLNAIHEDAHWEQRQTRCVEYQEQDLRVSGGVRVWIQRLQLAHGAQADGGRGVVEAERVRRKIQCNQTNGRVPARHLRHEPGKQRSQPAGEGRHQPGALGNLKKTQPQRQRAEQEDHHLHGQLGHFKQAAD
jgi:hypothetical protein